VLNTLLFRTSVVAVLLFGTLWFLGDFSGRQSLVLAAIGGLVFGIVLWLQKPPFVPYRVFVTPNMRSILRDFQIVEDTKEAWTYVQEVIEKLPHRPGNIWEYGFRVSFITPELIYYNEWKDFKTEVKMLAGVDPAGWWEDEIIPRLLAEPISLYLEEDRGGYALGVVLRKEYWERVRHNQVLKRIPETDIKDIGEGGLEVKVKLAHIPNDEFIFYSVIVTKTLTAYESAVKRRDEARSRCGWNKPVEQRPPYADTSQIIEHRYYTVSHSAL
jgi:hypothetical protein